MRGFPARNTRKEKPKPFSARPIRQRQKFHRLAGDLAMRWLFHPAPGVNTPFRHMITRPMVEDMSTETLLIIVVLVLLFGGGGFFYSRRGR